MGNQEVLNQSIIWQIKLVWSITTERGLLYFSDFRNELAAVKLLPEIKPSHQSATKTNQFGIS